MQTIETYIRAGYSAIFVQTQEEDRAVKDIKRIAHKPLKSKNIPSGYNTLTWTVSNGIDYKLPEHLDATTKKREELLRQETQDPSRALSVFMEAPEKIPRYSILIMLDLHLHLKGNNPMLIRMLKEAIRHGRKTNRHIIMVGAEPIKHPELEKEIQVVDLPLPDKAVLTGVLEDMARAASIEANGDTDALVSALSGLTAEESANALAFSLASKKRFDVELISKIKTESIKKNGIVEIVETHAGDMDGIGGLENIKAWLRKRVTGFTKEAREFGLEAPKGYMLIGISGCGKSEVCKVTASMLKVPMLRMDGGKIFGHFVGDSEKNMRTALATAEAIAPCLLFVDELDKAMTGTQSSGMCDGGTTSRVIGTFLQWMQDKTAPVFVVATANDVSQLPPEMLRRGRFDQIFFVDLPDHDERQQIWSIHIRKVKRNPKDHDLDRLSKETEGYTGAEIASIVRDGLCNAFHDGSELTTDILSAAIQEVVPLSKTMKERITSIRQWANGRAIRASGVKTLTKTEAK